MREDREKIFWEIPREGGMRVPGMVIASEALLEAMKRDATLDQVRHVAHLKGIVYKSLAMPDAHQGYGFPIGGVAGFDIDEGIISPGGVGYDINCGVRLLATPFSVEDIRGVERELLDELFSSVPSGVGSESRLRLSRSELEEVLVGGARWAVEHGFGSPKDLSFQEEEGVMEGADPGAVSDKAYKRGLPQLGTLGSGNHFLEVQVVDRVFDERLASVFGIREGALTVMIHCGSRGLGHQVASDYIHLMEREIGTTGLPSRELVNAPFKSRLGQEYYSAMTCAVNYAFANRQMITHWVRESFEKVLGSGGSPRETRVVYDVCHNIAKVEEHEIGGEKMTLVVHRKGATRCFPGWRREVPRAYEKTGQPVLIPGSMGTASYILAGRDEALEVSLGSTAHGAGRVLSRSAAIKRFSSKRVQQDLEKRGVLSRSASRTGLAEEAPEVYKDIEEVVRVSCLAGLTDRVARVRPLLVVKG